MGLRAAVTGPQKSQKPFGRKNHRQPISPRVDRLAGVPSTEETLTSRQACRKLDVSGSKLLFFLKGTMAKRTATAAGLLLGTLVLCATLFATSAGAQIAKVSEATGRQLFVNAEPPATLKLGGVRPRATIYLPGESSFTGRYRPAVSIDRDGTERLVREAAERHRQFRWDASPESGIEKPCPPATRG